MDKFSAGAAKSGSSQGPATRRHVAKHSTVCARYQSERHGRIPMKSAFLAAVATAAMLLASTASAQGVKIGVLNDQSGVYADYGGKWSVEAARMAVEDFGGKVLNAPVELVNADHQNKPDIASNIARQWYDV